VAILTTAGRTAIATSIKALTMHLAWGPGDGSWTTPPAESAAATVVTNEIGRRLITSCDYVVPDSAGAIEVPDVGRFSVSVTPTNRLFVVTRFDFADAPTATIRQLGLFVGCTTNPALPPGQKYFTPDQIVSPGTLLEIANQVPKPRSPATREQFEFLIVF
jgi:hypothetical protein